jgi:hypothetical protein
MYFLNYYIFKYIIKNISLLVLTRLRNHLLVGVRLILYFIYLLGFVIVGVILLPVFILDVVLSVDIVDEKSDQLDLFWI